MNNANQFDGFLNSVIASAVNEVFKRFEETQELFGSKKQVRLSTFKKMFDITNTKANQLAHTKGFPSYKIDGTWYVDIKEFYEWRKNNNLKNLG